MERYHVNTGDEGPVYARIDEFFQEVMDEIGINKNIPIQSQFEIKIENHCKKEDIVTVHLDNKTHMLLYKQKVVAVVLETRTELNYIQFDFFKNLENLLE